MKNLGRRSLSLWTSLALLLGPGLPARAALIEAAAPLRAAAPLAAPAPLLAAAASASLVPVLTAPSLAAPSLGAPAALPASVLPSAVAAQALAAAPAAQAADSPAAPAAVASFAPPVAHAADVSAAAATRLAPASPRSGAATVRSAIAAPPSGLSALMSAAHRRAATVMRALSASLALALASCSGTDDAPTLQEITDAQVQTDIQNAIVSDLGAWNGALGDWNHDASYQVQTSQKGTLTISMGGVQGAELNLLIYDSSGHKLWTNDNTTSPGAPPFAQLDEPAGNYYVLIHNNNDGGVGLTYIVNATFVADVIPPDGGTTGVTPITQAQIQSDLAAAPTIPLGPWTGIVGDASSDSAFKLILPQAGTLSVSLSGVAGAEFDLILLDANSKYVGDADNTTTPGEPGWVQESVAAGSYYVLIHNNNSGGIASTYALNTSLSPIQTPPAYPISSTQIQADIASSPAALVSGAYTGVVGDPSTDAVYSLSVGSDGPVTATVDGVTGVEFDLLLTDAGGNPLAQDSNSTNPGAAGNINAGLKSGAYYLIVHNNNGAGVGNSFTLNVSGSLSQH